MSGKNHDRRERVADLEAGSGWISRAEAREILGVSELELRELSQGFDLSRRTVSLYLRSEIRALAEAARRLR
ncbi:hypothetical protein [Singulisphaera sp. PoT]|uniref:hypothetical protein n=1 Tax=Singulisphaera sp. PoT TaxID=3411797 RepID=UPI003BF54098